VSYFKQKGLLTRYRSRGTRYTSSRHEHDSIAMLGGSWKSVDIEDLIVRRAKCCEGSEDCSARNIFRSQSATNKLLYFNRKSTKLSNRIVRPALALMQLCDWTLFAVNRRSPETNSGPAFRTKSSNWLRLARPNQSVRSTNRSHEASLGHSDVWSFVIYHLLTSTCDCTVV
jgi:hypothetical protein